jgi:hypothetical protein
MYWRQTRLALLAAGTLAAAALLARGQDPDHPAPAPATADGCAPPFRTVWVKEWVPETYERVRTVYHPEKRIESYTAYRCESVNETAISTCVPKQVPYQATRTVCVYLPHQETVTCTRMVCHIVQKQVPCAPVCETTSR